MRDGGGFRMLTYSTKSSCNVASKEAHVWIRQKSSLRQRQLLIPNVFPVVLPIHEASVEPDLYAAKQFSATSRENTQRVCR